MEPASAILSLLGQHIDAIPNVKFLITGRPEPPIRTGFRVSLLQKHTEVFLLHEVDRASVDQDIELYLRTRLSEIVMGRSHCDLTVLWPTDKEITITIKKCSGLFIVASVIVKFVADPNRRPQDRLKIIISDPDNTVYEGKSGVDVTYHQIFVQSFDYIDVDDTEFYEELRLVVGSIVLALNPLSCADLATILDISPESVRIAIRSLHSVLVVPDSDSELLRICHKSFADFLTNSRRCKDKRFYIEPAIYHLEFATSCLNLMKKLERNICDLPPYAMNEDIRDLGQRREKCIGGGLEYACRSWAKHLRSSSSGGYNEHIVKFLEYFFKHNLLSWLEVMSIVGDVGCAIYLLRDAKVWLIDVGLQDTDLFAIVNDSERFVLRFFEAIEESAPHIYDSALLWSPASSLVRALYQNQIPREAKLLNAIEKSWDACTREVQTQSTIALPFNRPTIIFSPKDDLIAVAEDGCVEIFEVMTGKHRAVFKSKTEDSEPRSLAFSPDSMVLMIGYSGGSIDVRDLQTGGLVNCEGHTDMVAFVAFSPCGTMVASCSDDHTIRIWDVPSYDSRCVLGGHSDKVQTACWTGTGSGRVISGSFDGTVRVWDVLGEKCLKTFPGHDRLLTVMSSDDSSFIAASSEGTRSDRRLDGTVKVIDAQNGDVIHMIPTEPGTRLTSFSYHDQVMYRTGSTIVMWDFRKNTSVLMFKHDGIGSTISLDRTCTASYHFPNLVKIWQVNSAIKNHDLAHPSIDVYLSCVAFSGDGLLIASGSRGGTVRLWDPISCLCLETFRGHSGVVRSAIFSPDSKLCASSSDHTIQVLDVEARAIVSTLNTRNVYGLFRFSPDSSQILSYSTYKSGRLSSTTHHLDLWKIETGEHLASTQIEGKPEVLAFTGDGTSVTTKFNNSAMEWKISPATASDYQDTDGDNKKDHLSLQMMSVPIHDIHEPLSTNVPSHQPYSMDRREWILDERKRRICWVPPDLRRLDFAYNGKTVALGRHSGMVTIIDFSGVR